MIFIGACARAGMPVFGQGPGPVCESRVETAVPEETCLAHGQANPLAMLPADVMLAYGSNGAEPDPNHAETIDRISALVQTARGLGLWPKRDFPVADVLAALPLLRAYPHALGLLDATCRARAPGSFQLERLQAVLILDVRGDVDRVERRIRELILTYTNDQVSTIETVRYLPAGLANARAVPVSYHRLQDSRLPEWAVCEWGRLGDHYIVSFGQEAWERAALAVIDPQRSLSRDQWFARAHVDCDGRQKSVQIHAHLSRIRSRLGEIAPETTDRVVKAMQAEDVRRVFWSIGRVGREVQACVAQDCTDGYRFSFLTDHGEPKSNGTKLVPEQADRYAVARLDLGAWLPKLVRGYVASRSDQTREVFAEWWNEYQEQVGVNAEGDILGALGPIVIFHTHPKHPLGVPLLCTVLVKIEGDADRVRESLRRLLAAPTASESEGSPLAHRPGFMDARRTDDGIWYWQTGFFVVMGMAVQDDWLVISFSPEAVRENLELLGRARTAPDSQPTRPSDAGAPHAQSM